MRLRCCRKRRACASKPNCERQGITAPANNRRVPFHCTTSRTPCTTAVREAQQSARTAPLLSRAAHPASAARGVRAGPLPRKRRAMHSCLAQAGARHKACVICGARGWLLQTPCPSVPGNGSYAGRGDRVFAPDLGKILVSGRLDSKCSEYVLANSPNNIHCDVFLMKSLDRMNVFWSGYLHGQ